RADMGSITPLPRDVSRSFPEQIGPPLLTNGRCRAAVLPFPDLLDVIRRPDGALLPIRAEDRPSRACTTGFQQQTCPDPHPLSGATNRSRLQRPPPVRFDTTYVTSSINYNVMDDFVDDTCADYVTNLTLKDITIPVL